MELPRYQGKPLLRLLELYVLNAIGELSTDDAEKLTKMQPKLANLYGGQGSWDLIIASTMGFPDNMSALIRETWLRNQVIAKTHNLELTPQQFAEMFVDHNLV